jgi:hypothetical protein
MRHFPTKSADEDDGDCGNHSLVEKPEFLYNTRERISFHNVGKKKGIL